MANKKLYKIGKKFGKWELTKYINGGGNGEVWRAKDDCGNVNAIKLLKKIKEKAYSRFRDEISAVMNNMDIKGVLPIIDSFLPDSIISEKAWYVMPIATPLEIQLQGKSTHEIVDLFILLAKTLRDLHNRKVCHRDIKPANLFYYDGRPCFGDFGLVDFPGKKDLTVKGESIGPMWTISPEMKRDATLADGETSDSYSFAKTLWIFLTNVKYSFEGQYQREGIIGLEKYLKDVYTKPLDDLMSKCTDNDPDKRPDLNKIITELRGWKEIDKDYQKRNKVEWGEVQSILFPASIPERVIWTDLNNIIEILNILAKSSNLNHMFLPHGGGVDLQNACCSVESDCVELKADGNVYVLKPQRLLFESFQYDEQWNYFRLESLHLKPLNEFNNKYEMEPLTELTSGEYTDYECYEYDEYNGQPLPKTARHVIRVLRGDFVICAKMSFYNKISSTYDGVHNSMSADEFRTQIAKTAKHTIPLRKAKKNINRAHYSKSKIVEIGRRLNNEEIKLIKKVIGLAEKVNSEEAELKKKYGANKSKIFTIDDDSFDFMCEIRPAKIGLEKHLHTLSSDDVVLIASVMYTGRDYIVGGRYVALDNMIDKFTKREGMIRSIMEKSPLERYLMNGLKAYT